MSNFLMKFHGGLNQAVDKQLISENEAYDMMNCNITKGNLSLCKGTKLYTTATLANPIKGLMKFYNSNNPSIVAVSNKTIYKLNGTVYGSISTGYTNNDFDYINYQSGVEDITIFTNGVEPVKVYDGSTIRDLKYDGSGSAVGANNKSPKGKFIELHKERLWICGDIQAPNRIYFSKDFDVDNFSMPVTEGLANTCGGFLDIPTFDGGKIIGIKALFDDIVIFKTRSIFRIYGTYPANFSVAQIFNIVDGEIIEKTMASLENKAYWVTTEGIFVWNGVEVVNITAKIQDTFSSLNKTCLNNSVGVIWKHKYILALPQGASTVNDLIIEYDIQDNNYTIKKGPIINSFLELDGRLLFTDNAGKILEYEIGTDFNGAAILGYWHTGNITFNTLDKKKRFSSINFVGVGDALIRVSVISEKKTKIKEVQLTAIETVYRVRARNTGRIISIRIENLNGTNFLIKSPEVIYSLDE
jgi:hypothetical protein